MKYTSEQLFAAAHAMKRTGGGFASRLAEAYMYADLNNQERILTAFMDLFEKFIPLDERLDAEMAQGNWFADLR
jgi:hypothetical protein